MKNNKKIECMRIELNISKSELKKQSLFIKLEELKQEICLIEEDVASQDKYIEDQRKILDGIKDS